MRTRQYFRGRILGIVVTVFAAVWANALTARGAENGNEAGTWSAVFTLTNDPSGNELAVFHLGPNGELAAPEFHPTGGLGTGGGLSNQGAVALSTDAQFLYAVNPGSGTITVFRLGSAGTERVQIVPSSGEVPVSLTVHHDTLYVVNADGTFKGGTDSIAGFRIKHNGMLTPLKNSVRNLSAAKAGPAQISFDASGTVLAVTERLTNMITLFDIGEGSLVEGHMSLASSGQVPFGFGFTRDDLMVVSEAAASTVSSYGLDPDAGTLETISASVKTNQRAACWIAITQDDAFAYSANAASNSISGFRIHHSGALTPLNEDGVTATTGADPTDLATHGNRFLFALDGGDGSVGVHHIGKDGSLTFLQNVGGLPSTHPTGLAVR